jgi:hypothetical protein
MIGEAAVVSRQPIGVAGLEELGWGYCEKASTICTFLFYLRYDWLVPNRSAIGAFTLASAFLGETSAGTSYYIILRCGYDAWRHSLRLRLRRYLIVFDLEGHHIVRRGSTRN